MSITLPDQDELDRLKAHETDAQQRFWVAHWDRTYGICARILGHSADAADIATDVINDFLFKYVDSVEHPRAIYSYVRLMATRRSLRRRKGRDRHGELVAEEMAEDTDRSAELAANNALLMPKLAVCLGDLTPKAQQVIKLRFGSEMTNEKIGGLVGGSKQYIGRLIKQSTEKLRECLQGKSAA